MATIVPSVITEVLNHGLKSTVTWATLTTTNDVGTAVDVTDYVEKTIQFSGTFGAGGSINLEGSNDGTTWFILKDKDGDAITITDVALVAVRDNPAYLRPKVTAGDGTTDIDVVLVATFNKSLEANLPYIYGKYDGDNNIIALKDQYGTEFSSTATVATFGDLDDAADHQYKIYHVIDMGISCISNGTDWVPHNGEAVLDIFTVAEIVVANTVITWAAADQGGKVRLTSSAGHGLTAASNGASIVVKSGTGWTALSLHEITYVDATHIDLLNLDWASQGIPIFYTVAEEIPVKTLAIPYLSNYGRIEIEQSRVPDTSSATTKELFIDFGGTRFFDPDLANDAMQNTKFSIQNMGTQSSQTGAIKSGNETGFGSVGSGVVPTGAIDTTIPQNLEFFIEIGAADETIALNSTVVKWLDKVKV